MSVRLWCRCVPSGGALLPGLQPRHRAQQLVSAQLGVALVRLHVLVAEGLLTVQTGADGFDAPLSAGTWPT